MAATLPAGHGAHETDVGGRKGVRLAQLTQSDVLRRPFADAADRAQPFYRIIESASRIEEMRVCYRRGGHRRQCGRPAARHAERR